MTISTTESRISYNGNGVTTIFAFPYRFFTNTDLTVILVDALGASTTLVLNTDYTVTGADESAGGTVTLSVAPAVGERLVIARVVPLTQEVDYITGDPFPAETHEGALDKLTAIVQQHQEQLSRTLRLPLESDVGASTIDPAAVEIVAGIAADVTTVALNNANVTTVATNDANVTIVATNIGNVNIVAGISADVTAVVAGQADIGIVATNIASVNTVATNIANVGTVATNIAYSSVQAFAAGTPDHETEHFIADCGAVLIPISTPSPVKAWHIQSSTLDWFEITFPSGVVNIRAFATPDQGKDATDDTLVIKNAFEFVDRNWWADAGNTQGKWQRGYVYIPSGIWRVDPTSPPILFDYLKIRGAGDGQSMIKAHNESSGHLLLRPLDATYNSSQRTTHCEIEGLRFIVTAANQVCVTAAHSGRLRIRRCEFTRQDRGNQRANALQTFLTGTVGVSLRNSSTVKVGGDIASIDECNFYFLARGIVSGGGVPSPGPEALSITRCEISDCGEPIVINNYGGARGVIDDCVLQRWTSTVRAIDLVGRRWSLSRIYFESLNNTTPPVLFRTGSENCSIDIESCINYTRVPGTLITNNGTNCTFINHANL